MDGKTDGIDLGDMISKLMSNPEFSTLVKSMKEGAGESGVKEVSAEARSSEETSSSDKIASSGEKSGADGGVVEGGEISAGAISSDMISKIPDIMSAIGPLMKNGGGMKNPTKSETENRNRLLTALKPYLGPGKREMIDTVLSVSKLTNLLDIAPNKKT